MTQQNQCPQGARNSASSNYLEFERLTRLWVAAQVFEESLAMDVTIVG